MNLRFIGIWVVLSVLARVALSAAYAAPWMSPLTYQSRELLTVLSMVAMPLAQWAALSAIGIRWGREWALATIAGGLFATVLLSVTYSPLVGLRPGAQWMLVFSIATAVATVLLRTAVLRRHSPRFAAWPAIGVLVWTIERVAQWTIAGAWTPGQGVPPVSWMWSAAIVATTAVIEAVAVDWIVQAQTSRSQVRGDDRTDDSGWLWLEWTTAASIGLLLIIGGSAPLETAFRGDPGWGALIGRPIFAVIVGVVIGGMQWLLLRNRLALSPAWIWVSVAAIAGPSLAIVVPALGVFAFFGWLIVVKSAIGMATAGAWFGACQWFLLRRHVRHAYWWIPATSLAWSTFVLNGYPVSLSYQTIGLIAGAISGLAVILLLKSPRAALPVRTR